MENTILYIVGPKGSGKSLMAEKMGAFELEVVPLKDETESNAIIRTLKGLSKGVKPIAICRQDYSKEVHRDLEVFAYVRDKTLLAFSCELKRNGSQK